MKKGINVKIELATKFFVVFYSKLETLFIQKTRPFYRIESLSHRKQIKGAQNIKKTAKILIILMVVLFAVISFISSLVFFDITFFEKRPNGYEA